MGSIENFHASLSGTIMQMKFFNLAVPVSCLMLSTAAVAQENPAPLPNAHAHNDYRHKRPFRDAFDNGFCSFEVDIYRVGDQLRVAHDLIELQLRKQTLQELYLDPMKKVVTQNGGQLYPNGPQTVTLLIDIKRDGPEVFELLKKVLLQYKEMLCCVEDGQYQQRAIKVIISGDRPEELIRSDSDRIMSIDGRVSDLDSDLSPTVMPLISDRWSSHFSWKGEGEFHRAEQRKLRKLVNRAHQSGRKIRFWATPESPAVWEQLATAGVDLINTDQLVALKSFLSQRPKTNPSESATVNETVTRIGMIGCHRQDKPAPAMNRYLQARPDIMVWMG